MTPYFIIFLSSCLTGTITAVFLLLLRRKLIRLQARKQAESLIKAVEEKIETRKVELEARINENNEQALKHLEKEVNKKEQKLEQLEIKLRGREEALQSHLEKRQRELNQKTEQLRRFEGRLVSVQNKFDQVRNKRDELFQKWQTQLLQNSRLEPQDIRQQIKQDLENETKQSVTRRAQYVEELASQELEKEAKRLVGLALHRFQRPYCAERGLGYVHIEDPNQFRRVVGNENSNIHLLEKACGVDLIVNNEKQSVSISGFDPVRRELARLSVERMIREQRLDQNRIETMVAQTKRDLFRKILQDGQSIAKELKVNGLHDEVKNMMGALRYRYSFSQNQFFHCAEVGYLCGLLSSELGLPIADGRRAGMLHDIGKAMDHSIEGGHAVIGADFISRHGEVPHIVHAVRSHHYDETPSTHLCYLVIAADAISGARPGARRSTVESYMQKMEELESIGNSFEGVLATYILSAGREVRVLVDSQKVDDVKAMQLSKDLATKIENEMAYPGQIKVTVVRETQAVDFAR